MADKQPNQTLSSVDATTYETNISDKKLSVVVGDEKQKDFYPRLKIKKWDNEVNFSVGVVKDETEPDNFSLVDNKIVWVQGKQEAHFYPINNKDGGFEFEVILKEKPVSNVVELSIQTKGLNFFYQPFLTNEEKLTMDIFRSEDVEGSYAVYHASKINGEYMAGKAFHIYRPKIFDATGRWSWGSLNIDVNRGILSITIPQSILDKGNYPLIVDPTFGYQTVGLSIFQIQNNLLYLNKYAGSDAGDNTYNRIFINYSSTDADSSSTFKFRTVIYKEQNSGPSYTKTRLAYSDEFSWTGTVAKTWKETIISDATTINSGYNAFLGVICYTSGGKNDSWNISYDSVSISSTDYSTTYGIPPTTFSENDTNDRKYSIYATYTAGGGASGPANLKSYNTNLKANIKSINTNIIANVKTLNTNV